MILHEKSESMSSTCDSSRDKGSLPGSGILKPLLYSALIHPSFAYSASEDGTLQGWSRRLGSPNEPPPAVAGQAEIPITSDAIRRSVPPQIAFV